MNSDLAPGQPVRNETYYSNLIWDVTKHLRLGFEVTYRKTAYTVFGNNEGIGFQMQMRLNF